jgi:hypothetical protein
VEKESWFPLRWYQSRTAAAHELNRNHISGRLAREVEFAAQLAIERADVAPIQAAGVEHRVLAESGPGVVVGSGIEFSERGSHNLKGIPGTWPIFAVEST